MVKKELGFPFSYGDRPGDDDNRLSHKFVGMVCSDKFKDMCMGVVTIVVTVGQLGAPVHAIPPEAGGHACLTYENTINTVEFINKMEAEEPEQFTIKGELLSASISNRNYLEVLNLDDGKKYSGNIMDSVTMNADVDLTIGRLYEITFEELTSINPATGEEKIERRVIQISYMSSNATLESS